MATLELNGKCRELGYCDCGGFFGCVDPNPPAPKPVIENELENAMKAERQTSDYTNSTYRHELETIETDESLLVECEVCDKSHLPEHPHIANVEGDVPVDNGSETVPQFGRRAIGRPDVLPDWLQEKPGSQVIRPATSQEAAQPLCQVCGEPWKSRHTCSRPDETNAFNAPTNQPANGYVRRNQTLCDVCRRVKRSNHNCKGAPSVPKAKDYGAVGDVIKDPAEIRAVVAGAQEPRDVRVATELPKQAAVVQPLPPTPETTKAAEPLDQELAAMGTILTALEGMTGSEAERMLRYVADRRGITFPARQ